MTIYSADHIAQYLFSQGVNIALEYALVRMKIYGFCEGSILLVSNIHSSNRSGGARIIIPGVL
jgi:hypothetical protein